MFGFKRKKIGIHEKMTCVLVFYVAHNIVLFICFVFFSTEAVVRVVERQLDVEEGAGMVYIQLERTGDLSRPTTVYCYTAGGQFQ